MKDYQVDVYGTFEGTEVLRYTFENEAGHRLVVMTYGATILEYWTPDINNTFENITIGFDNFEDYIQNAPKWGAAIGPVGGRIAKGQFTLNGQDYQLETNQNGNHLHGGTTGFDGVLFQVDSVDNHGITFYESRPDGTGNYPGNLQTWITYSLDETGDLQIDYKMESDQDTLVNPTNHTYFNLLADDQKKVDSTIFQLNTKGLVTVNDNSIPTGQIDQESDVVKGLQEGLTFAQIFASDHPQLVSAGGLDHPFVLDLDVTEKGSLYEASNGRRLSFETDRPAVVVYTSNGYDDKTFIKGQVPKAHIGVALETQQLPDAINQEGFGDIRLLAGQVFQSTTIYHPSVV